MLKCKLKNICLWSFLLSIIVVAAGCSSEKAVESPEIKKVKGIFAQNSSIAIHVEYAGKIKPAEETLVNSKIVGRVSEIRAEVGDSVKKGEVLFVLDGEDAGVIQADSAIGQAQIRYDDAKDYYDDAREMYEAGAIPKQQLEDAQSMFKNAEIQLNAARNNAGLLSDRGGLAGEVTSPAAGVVAIRNINTGDLISPSVPAYSIINATTLFVEVNIPDRMAGKLAKGQKIPVRINALEGKVFEGVVAVISPAADARTQSYLLKVKVENPEGEISPGMFAKVSLPAEDKDDVLVVPSEAIVVENGVQYVYTVAEGKVLKKAVETGLANDSITEVAGNLKSGEFVITEGQNFLTSGEEVKAE